MKVLGEEKQEKAAEQEKSVVVEREIGMKAKVGGESGFGMDCKRSLRQVPHAVWPTAGKYSFLR